MIDTKIVEQLDAIALEIKAIMDGHGGQVIFNCPKDKKMDPKVTLMLADVTEVKK